MSSSLTYTLPIGCPYSRTTPLGVHFLSLYESRVVSSSSGVASRRPPLQAQRLRDFGEATEAEEAERSTSKSAVKEVGSSIALKPPRQSFQKRHSENHFSTLFSRAVSGSGRENAFSFPSSFVTTLLLSLGIIYYKNDVRKSDIVKTKNLD